MLEIFHIGFVSWSFDCGEKPLVGCFQKFVSCFSGDPPIHKKADTFFCSHFFSSLFSSKCSLHFFFPFTVLFGNHAVSCQ